MCLIVAPSLVIANICTAALGATSITPTPGAGNLGTTVTQNGTVYGITGGRQAGTNLFHSFGQFTVATGNTAQFQTSNLIANPTMSNILGRITGGNPSAIFGAIDSATFYPSANLFLMNPAGFLFGPSATVNVGGMMHVTTADYLKLADGNMFKAVPDVAADALLTTSPVATFGFLGSNPAAIAVQGSQLTLADGTGLSLVGGYRGFTYTDPDTDMTNSAPDGVTMTGGSLSAPSGQINLVSVASPGEISAVDYLPTPGMTMGSIALFQGAVVATSGETGGTVHIRGGQFIMDQAALVANSTGTSDGVSTGIDVNVTNGIAIENQSALLAWATGAGQSGDIIITGRTIDVSGGSFVYTNGLDSGSSGSITVTGSESISVRGDQLGNPSGILSDASGSGSTGMITLRAPLITLADMGAVETRMFGFGPAAHTGDIIVEATNLNLLNGGMIRTTSGNEIASGNISVTAENSITLSGTNDITATSNITNENISGGTGTITIETGSLTLSEQARVNSQTWFDTDPAAANTPKIAITAESTVTLLGGSRIDVGGFISDTGSLQLSTSNLTMSGLSSITTLANAGGASGPIVMNVHNLTISEGSQILSSSGQGAGRGGDITINGTGSVLVTGQGNDPFGGTLGSGIFSNTVANFEDPSFIGNAGNIHISAQSIEVSNGARIDSSSQGYALGNAGNIDLIAPTIAVSGGTVSTSTEFAGQAGAVTLHSDTVTLNNGGQIASNSVARQTPFFEGEEIPLPTGNAGSVIIEGTGSPAQSVLIDGFGSGIFTDTQGTGAGGNIFVNANTVTLSNGGTLSAATSSAGDAGNINITADTLALDGFSTILANTGFGSLGEGGNVSTQAREISLGGGSSISTGTLGLGDAGDIRLQSTERIILSEFSGIVSNSSGDEAGNAGTIHLTAPTIELHGSSVNSLSQGPGNAGAIILEANTATGTNESSLVSQTIGPGRGGDVLIQGFGGPGTRTGNFSFSSGSTITSSSAGDGRAGDISILTERITLTNSGLNSSAAAGGDAGNITVDASESVHISTASLLLSSTGVSATGNAGQITILTSSLTVDEGGLVSTSTSGTGNAGSITVNASSVSLLSGGQLSSSSSIDPAPDSPLPTGAAGSVIIKGLTNPPQFVLIDGNTSGVFTDTQGTGPGGNIVITADLVALDNGGKLSATTSGTEPSATGGTITLNAGQVQVNSGGLLTASTTGAGAGGSINVSAGSSFSSNAGTVSTTATQATGGDINISAGQSVTLDNGSVITASSNGEGNAGNIVINAGQQYTSTNSSVTTKADQASGGNITVLATGLVHLTNSELNASVEGSSTTVGGNILIDPVYVILENSQILAQATQGQGGNINIFYTGALLADPSTVISASSQFGQSGTVTIQSPISPASGKIVPLGQKPLIATSLLSQRCAAISGGSISSFTVGGRDSVPAEPGNWLSSPLALGISAIEEGTVREEEKDSEGIPLLSLRKVAPAGFLTQNFAVDRSAGCS